MLEKFVTINKYDRRIYQAISKIYATLGKIDLAIKYLKIIINEEPENLKAYSSFLFSLLYSENYNQENYIRP